MIIYGTKSTKLQLIDTDCQCPFCGKENSLAVLPYQKSFHVYWIPVIPTSKELFVVCKACGKDVPEHYIGGITPEVKKKAKTPFTSFIGLFIILALAAFISYVVLTREDSGGASRNNAVLILTYPQVGDVLEMKIDQNQYTACRITSISGDSIYLQFSENAATKKKHLTDLKKSLSGDAYSEDLVDGYTKVELFNLIDKGVIIGGDKAEK